MGLPVTWMGKASRKILEIISKLSGAESRDVVLGPHPCIDAGIEKVCGGYRVYSVDPTFSVPLRDLGYLAFCFSFADVAVVGGRPSLMINTILLPADAEGGLEVEIARQLDEVARRYGVKIITGHTGRYSCVREPVVVSTAIGFTKKPLTPDDVLDGDSLILIRPLGSELLYSLANLRPDVMESVAASITVWSKSREELNAVDPALLMYGSGFASYMKDLAEGGLIRAINDLANLSGLGFEVVFEELPIPPELIVLSEKFGFDPLAASSSGTVLAVVRSWKADMALDFMRSRGFVARIIGKVLRKGRYLVREGNRRPFPEKAEDPYAKVIG